MAGKIGNKHLRKEHKMTILGYIALSALFMFIIQCITNNKPEILWEIVWGIYKFILGYIIFILVTNIVPEPH